MTERQLREELDAGRLNGSALTKHVLGDAVRGAASSPEAEMCDSLLAEAGPGLELLLNPWIYLDGELLGSVDGLIRGTGFGYESDSWEHHASDTDAEQTIVRSDRYTASGAVVARDRRRDVRVPYGPFVVAPDLRPTCA